MNKRLVNIQLITQIPLQFASAMFAICNSFSWLFASPGEPVDPPIKYLKIAPEALNLPGL
jgi:hypothetical protein